MTEQQPHSQHPSQSQYSQPPAQSQYPQYQAQPLHPVQQQYSPQPAAQGIQCPNCNGRTTHITATNQYYCERCRTYIQNQAPAYIAPQPQQAQPISQSSPAPVNFQPVPSTQFSPSNTHGYANPGGPQVEVNINMITHALEKGTTVYDKSRNSIYYLPDERVQSLGVFSIERDMSMYNMTMFKGEMFLTQYRMVFVEKSRFLDPNWMSFWFNVDFEGRRFQVEKGAGSVYDCKGMYLEMELKPVIKSIDLHVRFVMMDNNLVPINILNHPIKIYKSELYQMLIQSRDTSPPIKASTLQEYLHKVKEPSGVYTFGTWDQALERAMRER